MTRTDENLVEIRHRVQTVFLCEKQKKKEAEPVGVPSSVITFSLCLSDSSALALYDVMLRTLNFGHVILFNRFR